MHSYHALVFHQLVIGLLNRFYVILKSLCKRGVKHQHKSWKEVSSHSKATKAIFLFVFFFTKITNFLTIFFYFDCFVRKTETWKEGGWILKVFVLPFLFLGGRVSSFDEMCPPLSGVEKVTSRMEDLRDTCYPIFKENLDKLQRPFDCSCCAFDVRNFPVFLFA